MPITDSIQSNKQHAVPQNIMDVEFKLIGDLTMRQFAYLILFGGVAYLSFVSIPGLFKLPAGIGSALLGIGLAFVPYQERGLDEWIINFVKAVLLPTQRIWKKDITIPSAFLYENVAVVQQELITLAPTSSRRKLEEYLKRQDSIVEDPLDIKERDYVLKVRSFYSKFPEPEPAPVSVGVATYPEPALVPEEPSESPQEEQQQKSLEESQTSVLPATLAPVKEEVIQPVPTEQPEPQKEQPQKELNRKPAKGGQQKPRTKSRVEIALNTMTPDMHSGRRFVNLLPGHGELILPIRGERVLRTTQEVEIEEDINEKAAKLQQLIDRIKRTELPKVTAVQKEMQLSEQSSSNGAEQMTSEEKDSAKVTGEAAAFVKEIKLKNEQLYKEIAQLRTEIQKNKDTSKETVSQEQVLRSLEMERERIQKEYTDLSKQLQMLQEKLKTSRPTFDRTRPRLEQRFTPKQTGGVSERSFEQKSETDVQQTSQPAQQTTPFVSQQTPKDVRIPAPLKPVVSKAVQENYVDYTEEAQEVLKKRLRPLTTTPNVISGFVKTRDGQGYEGILVIIKNEKSEPVRALKSNRLGQFIFNTPLLNGTYKIEAKSVADENVSFDIIKVDLNGGVVAPIEMQEK